MTAPDYEFPPAALFDAVVTCPWRERSVRVDGSLGDWSDDEVMPPLGEVAGGEQYARLLMAWNEHGLYVAVDVPKSEPVVTNRESPGTGDALELFIDTRGAQSSHRATQFCYRLCVLPAPPGSAEGGPVIWQRPIARAMHRSPAPDFDAIRVASGLRDDGYALELAFEPDSLHGYEPAAGLRISLAAVVHDIQRGRQYWGTAADFPYERDPSTWTLVEHAAPDDA